MSDHDRNDLGFWFPAIEAAGLPVPRTRVVFTGADLTALLDGETPPGWDKLIEALRQSGDELGYPCFLRTGHTSGKHEWRDTCFVDSPADFESHVAKLVEFSACVDVMGLPTHTWAVREYLPIESLFDCPRYGGMPVVREFRFFASPTGVDHIQPYWPPAAVADGGPLMAERYWRRRLEDASNLRGADRESLAFLAGMTVAAVGGGYWSIDFLQDRHGCWWLTDMAEGERSFRWDPREVAA